jgi:hypothetical protein
MGGVLTVDDHKVGAGLRFHIPQVSDDGFAAAFGDHIAEKQYFHEIPPSQV